MNASPDFFQIVQGRRRIVLEEDECYSRLISGSPRQEEDGAGGR